MGLKATISISLMLFLYVEAVAAQNATGGTYEEPRITGTAKANEFIDEAIVHWRELLRESGYDPLHVNSFSQGMINCRNCMINGLSTIKRTGDVLLNASGSFLIVDLNMGLADVSAACDCEAKWAIFTVEGSISGNLIDYSIAARIEQIANARTTRLTSLEITNEGELNTYFNGNGFLGTILQWFGQSMIRSQIRKFISDPAQMKRLLGNAVHSLNIGEILSFS